MSPINQQLLANVLHELLGPHICFLQCHLKPTQIQRHVLLLQVDVHDLIPPIPDRPCRVLDQLVSPPVLLRQVTLVHVDLVLHVVQAQGPGRPPEADFRCPVRSQRHNL